jgi:hypothetical protein
MEISRLKAPVRIVQPGDGVPGKHENGAVKMQWEFKFHPEENYLEVRIKGKVSSENLNKMSQEAFLKMRERQCSSWLLDYTEVEEFQIDFTDVYDKPKDVSRLGIVQNLKTGILIDKKDTEQFKFGENVFRNRGFNTKVFSDRKSAIEFLAF